MKISPAILIGKKCHSHKRFLASKCECGFPKLRSSCHPQQWLLGSWRNARSKVNKETGLAPDSWGSYERNKFSETRGLYIPIHRMLNSFFKKHKFIYFNWRLITLQYCIGFAIQWHPLYHASNLDWRFVSHMLIYMFQCHSPKSSYPRPLPQCPKDCSIHLFFTSFPVSHTGSLLPSF